MDDPRHAEALRIAQDMQEAHKLVELGVQVQVQLRDTEAYSPVLAILSRAQDCAAAAMVKLTEAPAERADVIRGLQHEVWRFNTLVSWLRDIVAEGDRASRLIDEERAEYLSDLVGPIDPETRVALGLAQARAPTE